MIGAFIQTKIVEMETSLARTWYIQLRQTKVFRKRDVSDVAQHKINRPHSLYPSGCLCWHYKQ